MSVRISDETAHSNSAKFETAYQNDDVELAKSLLPIDSRIFLWIETEKLTPQKLELLQLLLADSRVDSEPILSYIEMNDLEDAMYLVEERHNQPLPTPEEVQALSDAITEIVRSGHSGEFMRFAHEELKKQQAHRALLPWDVFNLPCRDRRPEPKATGVAFSSNRREPLSVRGAYARMMEGLPDNGCSSETYEKIDINELLKIQVPDLPGEDEGVSDEESDDDRGRVFSLSDLDFTTMYPTCVDTDF